MDSSAPNEAMNQAARQSSSQGTPDDFQPGGTTPSRPDWAGERDAGHIWSALSGLKEKTGELAASSQTCTHAIDKLIVEVRGLDDDISELKAEQKATAKLIKWGGVIATPLLAVVAILAPYFWNNGMRPDLERRIAAQVKADVDREQAARESTRKYEAEIADLKAQLRVKANP